MTKYEKLLIEAYNKGLKVREIDLKTRKGHCFDKRIAIDKNIATTVEKACILQEEINHAEYTVGNITNQSEISNIKQELFARAKTIQSLCNPEQIVNVIKKGAANKLDIIEMLDITESLFNEAVSYYSKKCPKFVKDSITLYFDNQLVIRKDFTY